MSTSDLVLARTTRSHLSLKNQAPCGQMSHSWKTFNVFPLGSDGTEPFENVFNSPGGEGEFELVEGEEDPQLAEVVRDAWNTVPWAVGTVAGLTAGQTVPGGSVFEFEVDLQMPGVLEYFQQSLASGQVAIFLSSLHDVSGFMKVDQGIFRRSIRRNRCS